MTKGKFITLEGGDFSGKSTQLLLLHYRLMDKGIDNIMTREPGGTYLGEKIRDILKTTPDLTSEQQFMLFHTARVQHVKERIRPSLDSGTWVICDRYIDSTRVYQHDLFPENYWDNYYNYGIGGELNAMPDTTFILDVKPETAMERMNNRKDKDHWDNAGLNLFHTHRNRYFDIVARDHKRYVIIDANQCIQKITDDMMYFIGVRHLGQSY